MRNATYLQGFLIFGSRIWAFFDHAEYGLWRRGMAIMEKTFALFAEHEVSKNTHEPQRVRKFYDW